MSIYGSLAAPCGDEHEDDCAIWAKEGDIWRLSDRPCDCGQPKTPLVYLGSNVLPAKTDPRGGWVDLALIDSHITRDGRDNRPDDEKPWPFLRFGVNDATVVLTREHVEQIHATLDWWLRAVEVGKVAA